jgi:hypothetical protein
MMQLRARNIRAGGILSIELAEAGLGTGRFMLSPKGGRHGFRLSPVIADSLAFSAIVLNDERLSLTAAAELDLVELQLYARVGDGGLRGSADVPVGGSLQITTAYDRITVMEQSSWWVLFEPDSEEGSSKDDPPPEPDLKPSEPSHTKGEKK